GRTFAGRARKRDVAAGLLDKSLDRTETQAPALVVALGRKKRIEGPLGNLRRHARAVVGEGDRDVRAGANVSQLPGLNLVNLRNGSLDAQTSTVRHRISGVDGQVENGRLQNGGVGAGAAHT